MFAARRDTLKHFHRVVAGNNGDNIWRESQRQDTAVRQRFVNTSYALLVEMK
jgi:hypothetical protein